MRLRLLYSFSSPLLSLVLLTMTLVSIPSSMWAQSEVNDKENNPLTTYRGTNRVLLLFAPSDTDPQFSKQIADLKNKKELDDRLLVVLPILADDKAAGKSLPFLQNKFNGGKSTFSLVLIGKDGNEAYQTSQPVGAETIYAKIDAMPMRKEEIKDKNPPSEKENSGSKKPKPDTN